MSEPRESNLSYQGEQPQRFCYVSGTYQWKSYNGYYQSKNNSSCWVPEFGDVVANPSASYTNGGTVTLRQVDVSKMLASYTALGSTAYNASVPSSVSYTGTWSSVGSYNRGGGAVNGTLRSTGSGDIRWIDANGGLSLTGNLSR